MKTWLTINQLGGGGGGGPLPSTHLGASGGSGFLTFCVTEGSRARTERTHNSRKSHGKAAPGKIARMLVEKRYGPAAGGEFVKN